jgi:hypothetical protein
VSWGLALIAVAVVIGWRRAKVDRISVLSMLVATAVALAYTYKSLGG